MDTSEPPAEPKLPWHVHAAAGWPLVLVVIGGAIGGALGGLAYGFSIALFKKKGQNAGTYLASIGLGIAAICLYFGVIFMLMKQFPDMFKK